MTFSTPVVLIGAALALGGCSTLPSQQLAPDEAPVIQGPSTRLNATPTDLAVACLARSLRDAGAPVFGIAVGDIKDYTGKFNQNEGNTVTQGGALMIYSSLGKMGGAVQVQERFDTRIAELELAYTDRRQLGDGREHAVEPGKAPVPWIPYFGGTILRSNYYIVGGITELNYNIASGGIEAGLNGYEARARTYTMNVGVDLRIVDTRTLVVARTISLQKQIVGEEVGAGVYRFFGTRLVDLTAGSKRQEPLQLGVRTAIEHGVVDLVAAVAGVDAGPCLGATAANAAANATALPAAPAPVAASKPAPQGTQSGLPPQNLSGSAAGHQLVPFETASSELPPQALGLVDAIAAKAAQGKALTVQLLARETELLPPHQHDELVTQRVRTVTEALVAKGVAASRIRVTFRSQRTQAGVTRYGAGYQLVATLAVGP